MTTDAQKIDAAVKSGLVLWVRVKAECLASNPFIREESGMEYITCPRCGREAQTMNYRTLGVEPKATEWSVPVQKCAHCNHLFALVR